MVVSQALVVSPECKSPVVQRDLVKSDYSPAIYGDIISTRHLHRVMRIAGVDTDCIGLALKNAPHPYSATIISEWCSSDNFDQHSFPFTVSALLSVLKGLDLVKTLSPTGAQ